MQCNRYLDLVRATAREALASSADAAPRVQSREPSVAIGVPAAQLLLDPSRTSDGLRDGWAILAAAGDADPLRPRRFDDTFGFTRPYYHPLLLHLHLRAAPDQGAADAALRPIARLCERGLENPSQAPLALWWALCAYDAGDRDRARRLADLALAARGADGSLHPRGGLDDLLDAWTYRELCGLHALAWLAILDGNEAWWRRVGDAARFHQTHTQPDYTTYQPWGCFAFFCDPQTTNFGEQQLHDTVTQLHIEGGGAGTVPALLLADAAAAMAAAAGLAFVP